MPKFIVMSSLHYQQLSPFLFVWLPLVVFRAAWSCCFFFFCLCICGGCSWLWSPCQLRWLQTFSLEGCHEESALFLCRDLNKTLQSIKIHKCPRRRTNNKHFIRATSKIQKFHNHHKGLHIHYILHSNFFFFFSSVPK